MTLFQFGRKHDLNLTEGGTVTRAMRQQSFPGMAYFAGTGPDGKTCSECANSYRKERQSQKKVLCSKFSDFTGKCGAQIPNGARACKYFEEKKS
jgi:predicted nucleic acid-binding Zn ribbon protein